MHSYTAGFPKKCPPFFFALETHQKMANQWSKNRGFGATPVQDLCRTPHTECYNKFSCTACTAYTATCSPPATGPSPGAKADPPKPGSSKNYGALYCTILDSHLISGIRLPH